MPKTDRGICFAAEIGWAAALAYPRLCLARAGRSHQLPAQNRQLGRISTGQDQLFAVCQIVIRLTLGPSAAPPQQPDALIGASAPAVMSVMSSGCAFIRSS